MRYTVIWSHAAKEKLARLWLDRDDKREIQKAADTIDQALRDDPESRGNPPGRARYLIEPPLIVFFRINEGDRKVEVFQVQHLGESLPSPNGQGSH